jgi:hypothetical protein
MEPMIWVYESGKHFFVQKYSIQEEVNERVKRQHTTRILPELQQHKPEQNEN